MLLLASCLAAAYFALVLYFLAQWQRLPDWDPGAVSDPDASSDPGAISDPDASSRASPPEPGSEPLLRASVLVVARDEAESIEACLSSLAAQDYPREQYEILLIDDHSTDDTVARAEALGIPNLRVLRLTDVELPPGLVAYKKFGLSLGVGRSRGELIATTDADCTVGPEWLGLLISRYAADQPVFIAGPVGIASPRSSLDRFQALDLLGTALITGAGHQSRQLLLANGANMAFPRQAFEAVGGYAGVDQVASGDDLLLLQKLAERYPGRTAFLKNPKALVRTGAMPDWPAFLEQRLRWASKTAAYRDHRATRVWTLVGATTLALVLGLLLLPWHRAALGLPVLVLAVGKAGADALLLRAATRWAGQPRLMRSFWTAQILHLAYVPWVATLALLRRTYTWKARRVH